MPLSPMPLPAELARRLIEREAMRATGPHARSTAAHAACEHLYRGLSRWLGVDGCQALFQRVLESTQEDQPALAEIQAHGGDSGRGLDGVAKAVARSGDDVTAAALEVLLAELIDLLGRFIGADMVVTLAEPSRAPDGPGGIRGKEE